MQIQKHQNMRVDYLPRQQNYLKKSKHTNLSPSL